MRWALPTLSFTLLILTPVSNVFCSESKYPSSYSVLEGKAEKLSEKNHTNGWGYIISGGLVLGISIPGFYLSEDIFARAIYSIGQTLGVASVGYGSYLVLVDNDYTRFLRILNQSGVPQKEKEILASSFLEENAGRAGNVRKIRVITHSLTAALNYTNALTTSQRELKTALFFLGGINTLAALSFGIGKSEEEELVRSRSLSSASLVPIPAAGLALQVRF